MIKEIVNTIEEIKDGDVFARVIGEFDSCPYFGEVKGLEIDGKVFKKINGKVYDCKMKHIDGTGSKAKVILIEKYETEYSFECSSFAIYKSSDYVNIASSHGISSNLEHKSNN